MSLTGEGFIFLSTVSYAFSSVMLKRYSKEENTVMLSGWQFVFGGIEIPINPIQKLREQIVQMHKIFTKDFAYAKKDVK